MSTKRLDSSKGDTSVHVRSVVQGDAWRRTYGSMAETAIDRSVDPALKARKDIFDKIFSKSEDSEERFGNY